MNEKQIKRFFEDRGKKIADVAREMNADFPGLTPGSADVMLRQLISGHRWLPVYAEWLRRKYKITVERPDAFRPVRERMKAAA